MISPAERDFDLALAAVAALLMTGLFLALYVPSSPVSSPGSGGVPAAPVTAGTSSP